jgi:hypothetical protein
VRDFVTILTLLVMIGAFVLFGLGFKATLDARRFGASRAMPAREAFRSPELRRLMRKAFLCVLVAGALLQLQVVMLRYVP